MSTRARAPRLDVACDLVCPSMGKPRVILSFQDRVGGGRLSTVTEFDDESRARALIQTACVLFGLRKSPRQDHWANSPSPALQRAIWRTGGRMRRAARARQVGAR